MARNARKTPEVRADSQADIAFLLLIFFLVATTMNTDTGIARMLPPMPPEDQQQEEIKVKERNLFLVFINGRGDIMAGVSGKQEPIVLSQLKDRAKEFVVNPMDDPNLPERIDKEIELADGSKWVYPVSEGVISLQTTRDTNYQSYIMVQNELTRAFNEVRDEVALRKFGSKYSELTEDERNAVAKAVPLKISEAEPRNIKR
ncbi:ExbD/TolR family protein [Alistipes sp. An66]|uniref:ExbD/TolR family protein n=1 Tax=Alistipes sp. An66 TaxID=1965650 RepID=UPI000B386E7E|nr:biopolymer transporter ExbD [Alistipes sp. An66]OUN60627.1 biopolymer transporter ExbD [Alistipes sp. An66]HIY15641.1 biopolymer transporter ExbD [Candidatus Alistipes cottocaccae]